MADISATLKQPKISIGLPVRNGETYLRKALDSILSQSYGDFEIIAADNASTDSTLSILHQYAQQDCRVKVFHHSENRGAAFNYNFVFNKSSGKFFKWAAHDDLIERTFLEKACSILDADPSAVLVYSQTIFIDEQGCLIEYDMEDGGSVENLLDSTARRFHSQLRKRTWYGNAAFGLMRKAALAKAGLIGGFNSSDLALLRNLALHGKIVKIPDPLFLRRRHAEMSVRANPNAKERHYWFTAQSNGFPKMWFAQHVKYHITGVARAELDPITKIGCWFSIAAWSFRKWDLFFVDIFPRFIRGVRTLYKKTRA